MNSLHFLAIISVGYISRYLPFSIHHKGNTQVYLRFFNLREQPFSITPDPRFLFLSPQHEAALSSLLYGINERKGFIEVTGEVGTGKTVLCRTLMDRLDDTVSTALIFNSYLNEVELLQAILNDFGVPCAVTSRKGYIDALNRYLLHEFAAGRNAMVLVDEAQNLEPRVLEQLRMLSNLETERGKLVQVVLVGQPELRDRLATPQMRQLDQRIAVRYHIYSLTRAETQQYIMHRLSIAGAANTIVFTRRAMSIIYRYCAGTPRCINLLCDRILITAYVRGTHRITRHIVRQSINDLEGARVSLSRRLRLHPTLTGIVAGGLASAALVGIASGWFPAWVSQEQMHHLLFNQAPPAIQPLRTAPPAPPVEMLSALPTPQPVSPPLSPPPPLHVDDTDMALAQTLWQLNVQAQTAPRPVSQAAWHQTDLLVQLAEQAALDLQLLWSSPPQLAQLSRPCLIEVNPERETAEPALWVIIRSSTENAVIYREPEGLSTIALPELRRIWSGKLYLTLDQSETRGPILRRGMSGTRVQTIQRILNELDYLSQVPSGQFDDHTEQAVRAFQRDHQLNVDGYVGRNTLMVLSHFHKKTSAAISDVGPPPQHAAEPPQDPTTFENHQRQQAQEHNAALVSQTWRYSIQVGSFRLAEQAERLRNRLTREGYTAWVQPSQVSGQGTWYRVRVGHFAERSEANEVAERLAAQEQLTILIAAETPVDEEPTPHEHH